MIRRPPRSTQSRSSAASDVYKRQPMAVDVDGLGEQLLPGAALALEQHGRVARRDTGGRIRDRAHRPRPGNHAGEREALAYNLAQLPVLAGEGAQLEGLAHRRLQLIAREGLGE